VGDALLGAVDDVRRDILVTTGRGVVSQFRCLFRHCGIAWGFGTRGSLLPQKLGRILGKWNRRLTPNGRAPTLLTPGTYPETLPGELRLPPSASRLKP